VFYIVCPQDRRGLFLSLSNVDLTIEIAIPVIKAHTVMDVMELQPHLNDFLASGVSLSHFKFAYMLLLARRNERTITRESSIQEITSQIFFDGTPTWTDVVMVITNNQVNPPGEDPFRYLSNEPPPVLRLQQVTTEVCKQQIEVLLLSNQLHRVQAISPKFAGSLAQCSGVTLDSIRPTFVGDAILLNGHSDNLFFIQPADADAQFEER
jgi:hypothetical protein